MKNFKILTIVLSVIVGILIILLVVKYAFNTDKQKELVRDYKQITEEGILRVAVNADPVDYFIYNGQALGFQLEMLENFAKDYNLELEISVEGDLNKGIELLNNRSIDILAQGLIESADLDLKMDLSSPVRETKLVLVQRNTDSLGKSKEILKKIFDLESRVLYVSSQTRNLSYLDTFLKDFARYIIIQKVDSISQEELISMVATGKIDYAICGFEYALAAYNFYKNIDFSVEMSLQLNIVWGVREESSVLLDTLNNWINHYKTKDEYKRLKLKYINKFIYSFDISSEYHSHNKNRISDYDEFFKKHAHITGWDWRLLISLAYEESRFIPESKSWAGAVGIMQILPETLKKYEDKNLFGVESEINAACKYIKELNDQLRTEIKDSITLIKAVLAAYNIGPGHIFDAICLSKKYHKDHNNWECLSYYIINLSNYKYYTDTCVKYGYFPGIFAVDFANSIYRRYKHYVNIFKDKK